MNSEQEKFLNLREKPFRLTAEQTAWRFGFQPHDIPVLMKEGCLHPLSRGHNTVKYFATVEIEKLGADIKWLKKATTFLNDRWQQKNRRKRGKMASSSSDAVGGDQAA